MSVSQRKLHKRLRRNVGKAIEDYQMINEGDRVMVCLSGGKDSYTMLDLLLSLQQSAPVNFHLSAVNLDQKQPGFPAQVLPEYLESLGVEYHIIESDTYSIVKDKVSTGATMCSLCSRLRRGHLYSYAKVHGMTKIALGHHRFDIMETFFLNLFYGGQLKAMPPKLQSDDGEHIVIRPLAYCDERDIAKYARLKGFPIIPCNLCGTQENLQRQAIKKMLLEWEKTSPQRLESIFSALTRIKPSHLLDRELFNFIELSGESGHNIWLIGNKARKDANIKRRSRILKSH
ncbi:MAG: tRNA 2-thiocytidine(32) synthetase TtcA [Cardiobacteriales bacterium]|nr:MAG: tRNA 2-thiocytidine(32) synthetase TtcA [Cardiobacteriales bacterium]